MWWEDHNKRTLKIFKVVLQRYQAYCQDGIQKDWLLPLFQVVLKVELQLSWLDGPRQSTCLSLFLFVFLLSIFFFAILWHIVYGSHTSRSQVRMASDPEALRSWSHYTWNWFRVQMLPIIRHFEQSYLMVWSDDSQSWSKPGNSPSIVSWGNCAPARRETYCLLCSFPLGTGMEWISWRWITSTGVFLERGQKCTILELGRDPRGLFAHWTVYWTNFNCK